MLHMKTTAAIFETKPPGLVLFVISNRAVAVTMNHFRFSINWSTNKEPVWPFRIR